MINLHNVRKYFYPSRILDIGANIGQFHQECKIVFPDSYVFSIEASLECEVYLKQLTDNYYIGLLAKDANNYQFFKRKGDPTCTGNSIYKELTEFYSDDQLDIIEQSGIRLDDLFTDDSEFDLIKIDTQGSELDILSGGMNIARKAKGILLEVSLTQYNQGAPLYQEVLHFMQGMNYKAMEVLDEARNHGSHQQDILFIKND